MSVQVQLLILLCQVSAPPDFVGLFAEVDYLLSKGDDSILCRYLLTNVQANVLADVPAFARCPFLLDPEVLKDVLLAFLFLQCTMSNVVAMQLSNGE